MPPSPRYTVRLPHALDALVQARVQAGTPFAVLIRDALSAYLADTPPTGTRTDAPTPADSADSLRVLADQVAALAARVAAIEQPPISADSADSRMELQIRLSVLTTRVEILEYALTPSRQEPTPTDTAPIPADNSADSPPTPTDVGTYNVMTLAAPTAADTLPTPADTDALPAGADKPPTPQLELSEDIIRIAEARAEYFRISERAFIQLLFDRGIYRHRAKDGRDVPIPHSTLRLWLQRARDAGLL